MATNNEKISIANLPELQDRLNNPAGNPETAQSSHLYAIADEMLSDVNATFKTRLGGRQVTVTKFTCPIEDSVHYARLARFVPRSHDETSASDTMILFDTTDSQNSIKTNNPNGGIPFHDELDGSVSIFMNRGAEPLNDEEKEKYLQIAGAIIGNLNGKYTELVSQIETEQEAKKHRIRKGAGAAARGVGGAITSPYKFFTNPKSRSAFDTYKTKGSYRRAWAVWLAVAAGINYGHLPFDDHPDAKIGDVPMPYPIEWFVDWANIPDHQATGFAKPDGALDIAYGHDVGKIPILPNYRTDGVPNTSSIPEVDAAYKGEFSKPGLWEANFSESYNPEKGWDREDAQFINGCFTIDGDYNEGKTEVFSKTEGVNDMITLNMPNSWTLEVCKKDNAPDDFKGSLFIYQIPDES